MNYERMWNDLKELLATNPDKYNFSKATLEYMEQSEKVQRITHLKPDLQYPDQDEQYQRDKITS